MLVQEERKACRGFGGAEIKDWEIKNMLTLQYCVIGIESSSFKSDTSLEQDSEGG